MSPRVRRAGERDAAAMAAVYNEGIAERSATFETAPRSAGDTALWLRDAVPPLVAEVDGAVAGFARAGRYSVRACYAGIAEASVYVAGAARGRGVGAALLEALAGEAERNGHWKLIARLLAGNEASAALFLRCGFRAVGVHRRHATLDGRWVDVLVFERLLGPAAEADVP
jgi:L-amino acid N-acyltransferase YncA